MNRLRELRKEKGLSKTELANRSGITRQTITRLEKEEVDTANSKTLKALADALEVRVTDFFSG
jgi:transcriptional regulator with XRE-family HTH domain